MYQTVINIPQVRDIETAVRLYYEQKEIGIRDICLIFGCGKSTANKLKKRGVEEMQKSGEPAWNTHFVNTRCAYRSWGLDIAELERGMRTMRKLRLNETEARA